MKQCLLLVKTSRNYLDHISRQIEKHNGRKRGKKTGEGRSNDYEKNMVKISPELICLRKLELVY